MSQPEESQEKTASTDAVLMHPDNDPNVEISQVPPPKHGETRVEQDGELRPISEQR